MVSDPWAVAAMVVGAYLVGSIPFGVLTARCLGTIDPRTAGSGNIGFSNVVRLSGKKAGTLTLLGDFGKGLAAGWAAQTLFHAEVAVLAVALAVVVGHVYSVFLRFLGGKGVATAMGALCGVAPWLAVAVIGVWLVVLAIGRYSAVAAVTSFVLLPLMAAGFGHGVVFVVFSVAVSLLILYRHRENMVRLWNRTEPRVGSKS